MDAITCSILANAIYETIKNGLIVGKQTLKEKLTNWVVDDETLQKISDRIQPIAIDDEWSEKKIERTLNLDKELLALLKNIQPSNKEVTVNQVHTGIGNNEVRMKF
jgi:hypothetical protein